MNWRAWINRLVLAVLCLSANMVATNAYAAVQFLNCTYNNGGTANFTIKVDLQEHTLYYDGVVDTGRQLIPDSVSGSIDSATIRMNWRATSPVYPTILTNAAHGVVIDRASGTGTYFYRYSHDNTMVSHSIVCKVVERNAF